MQGNKKTNPVRIIIYAIFTIGVIATLVYPIYLKGHQEQQSIGEVAAEDIHAPYTLTYESSILTEQAKDTAANDVPPIYQSVDPSIARQQIERLQIILNHINLVRQDSYASTEQKINDINKVPEITLGEESITEILSLNGTGWQLVQQESIIVLEQVMRKTIREGETSLAVAQIPPIISYTLSESLALTLTELISPLVTANSLYNQIATNEAVQNARNLVVPVKTTYVAGQTIINQGEVISNLTWEALDHFNLLQISDLTRDMVSASLLGVLASSIIILAIQIQSGSILKRNFAQFLLLTFFLLYLIIARIAIPEHTILPYLFPIAGFALSITGIFSSTIGFITGIILSILTAYNLPMEMDLTIFYFLTTIIGLLTIGSGRRVTSFITTGLWIGLIGSIVIISYRLPLANSDWFGIITLCFSAIVYGIAAAGLALIMRFLLGKALGVITPLELLDLSRPDHPLLQQLMRTAPGTYQHSLQVANLAEQAAESIGADPLLTRVGALFHDIGKSEAPAFFIENQIPGQQNPHELVSPLESSKTIQNHVILGIELAKDYNLPPQIQNFILEHHGTMITRYQYITAMNESEHPDDINDKDFQYPGPAPMSKETALVMLADGCEARFRAELPDTEETLIELISSQIEYGREEGQLINTDLTLNDLEVIKKSFVRTLKNMQHLRIKYPKLEGRNSEE
ncbi:MAG: HDIG domain-containing protein [Anaerolineaceae bacterium]|nr:HDIG domain-containing protein [Anaerolineaceae bacterium]